MNNEEIRELLETYNNFGLTIAIMSELCIDETMEMNCHYGKMALQSFDTADCLEELLRLRELCDDLHFAYMNKDADCPHQFETEALEKYKQLKEERG